MRTDDGPTGLAGLFNRPVRVTGGWGRRIGIGLATVLICLGAAVAGRMLYRSLQPAEPAFAYGMRLAQPRAVHPVTLRSAQGPLALAGLKGRWVLLFFGYTNCPDVCPSGLQYLSGELKRMGNAAKQVEVLFVSVDPARDTPEGLESFVHYFHPDFRAATGTKSQLDQLTTDVGAAYFLGKSAGNGQDYEVSHSTSFYVLDPAGRAVAIYGSSGPPGKLAQDFQALR